MATSSKRRRVAVVGGGITGLAAAWELAREDDGTDVVVIEAAGRCGGRIETVSFAGCPLDTGPDAFITRTPAAEELCRELGLGDMLIAPASSEAAILAGGALRPIPKGLVMGVPTDFAALLRAGVLSPAGILRAAADLVLPRSRPSHPDDPSVAEALGPRLGVQVLQRLIEPLVGGINAGSAEHLSLASTAPQLASMLAGRRSVILALRKARSAQPAAGSGAGGAAGAGGAGGRPLFLGLERGLESLVQALAAALAEKGAEIRLGQAVDRIERRQDRYVLRLDPVSGSGPGSGSRSPAETLEVDGVVVAAPAHRAAEMLEGLAPAAAKELASIRYASVAIATFAWPVTSLPHRPANAAGSGPSGAGGQVLPGSGFLVPRDGRHLITAATFTSSKWPRSTVPGRVVIRASSGHVGDRRAESLTDRELVTRVREELMSILGISDPPLAHLLRRHPQSFPQYEPGHSARVQAIRGELSSLPGLQVAGSAFDGIGIPACIASGRAAARAVLAPSVA